MSLYISFLFFISVPVKNGRVSPNWFFLKENVCFLSRKIRVKKRQFRIKGPSLKEKKSKKFGEKTKTKWLEIGVKNILKNIISFIPYGIKKIKKKDKVWINHDVDFSFHITWTLYGPAQDLGLFVEVMTIVNVLYQWYRHPCLHRQYSLPPFTAMCLKFQIMSTHITLPLHLIQWLSSKDLSRPCSTT